MDVIFLTILGLIAGWLASIVRRTDTSTGIFMDIALGIVGAFIGGFLMSFFSRPTLDSSDTTSVIMAVVGAVGLILVGRRLNLG